MEVRGAGGAAPSVRLRSLDHLRGIAALVVVVHHSLLTAPALADQYHHGGPLSPVGWLITWTPLHLVWAGGEAVLVFFVLSGFVLTRPFLTGGGRAWGDYAASRFVRLYVPVAGAVAFTVMVILLVPRHASPGNGWWLDTHAVPTSPTNILQALVLVWDPSPLNGPLWSLKWEVLFSAALPLYVWVARRLPPTALLVLALALACQGVAWQSLSLAYLPVFAMGAALGRMHDSRLMALLRTSPSARLLTAALACLMLTARWWPLAHHPVTARGVALLGATLLVAVAWSRSSPATVHQRWLTWLGDRSFSLYLVHEPVVVSVSMATGLHGAPVALLAVPLSLVIAAGFYRCVERPSHRLARRVHRRSFAAPEPVAPLQPGA